MKTVYRGVGILLGIGVVVLVAAALILPRVIDSAQLRDRISALVKEKTGRELVIAGAVSWSVFPWLGVEMRDLRLANARGFGAQPFAQIAAVQVRVKLLPLLRKDVEMSTVVVDGLEVNLAKSKDGRSNWQDLWPTEAELKSGDRSAAKSELLSASMAALVIGGVQVRDARVVMDDQSTGTQRTIEALTLQLGEIRPDQPIEVSLDFVAKGGAPVIETTVTLRGHVTPTEMFKRILLPDLELTLAAQGKTLPNGQLDAKLTADLAYDAARDNLAIKSLALNTLDLSLRGEAQGTEISGEQPQLNGRLSLERSSPRAFLKLLGQPVPLTSDHGVLETAAGEFLFQATLDSAQLTQLKLQFDDSVLTGVLGVKTFAKPAIDFNLGLDTLDLDRYLPPQPKNAAQAESSPPVAADVTEEQSLETVAKAGAEQASKSKVAKRAAAELFPVQMLRDLHMNGTLNIGVLKAYQLRSSDVSITVSAKNGLVRVFPARAKLYQGSYNGDISVDVRGKRPHIAMDEKLRGVQVDALLTDTFGESKLTGRADVTAKLSATGNRMQVIRKTLNGDAKFAFSDGVIKGMDVIGEIRSAYAVVRGKPAVAASKQTEFSRITGTATVANGVVNNPDLLGESPLMHVAGKGAANLLTQQLDYRINATLVDSLEGKGELTGRPIPVQISGDFAAPKLRVDLQRVLKQEVQQQLQNKLQDKINSDMLKGLLGR